MLQARGWDFEAGSSFYESSKRCRRRPERRLQHFQAKQGIAVRIHRDQGEETKGQLATACLDMFLAFASAAAYGADLLSLIEFKDHGSIDWTAGVVTAKGIGDPSTYSYPASNPAKTKNRL